jgi:membrane associated rhomboid family serine protease
MTEARKIWNTSGPGIKLILVNVLVYIVYLLFRSVFTLTGQAGSLETFFGLLQLPGSLQSFIWQPWSLVTHMFVHTGFWHIAFNMLTLFFTLNLFNQYFSENKIIRIYLYSGLAGAIVFMASVNIFPFFSSMTEQIQALGASAAVMGIIMAVCFFRPSDEVLLFGVFRIKLWVLALVFILADIAQIGTGNNAAGHLAHLGGALYGYLWAVNLKKGRDIAGWPHLTRLRTVKKTAKNISKRRITVEEADESYNMSKRERQQKVDEILDKISRSGYDSLSKEEKRILFEISREK